MHDELYHWAKLGEGCRCENVLFVTGSIKFTQGQKSGVSPLRGDSFHRCRSNFAGPTGTWVRLAVQNFASNDAKCRNAAQKYQKFPLFGKESPSTGEPLDQLLNF